MYIPEISFSPLKWILRNRREDGLKTYKFSIQGDIGITGQKEFAVHLISSMWHEAIMVS